MRAGLVGIWDKKASFRYGMAPFCWAGRSSLHRPRRLRSLDAARHAMHSSSMRHLWRAKSGLARTRLNIGKACPGILRHSPRSRSRFSWRRLLPGYLLMTNGNYIGTEQSGLRPSKVERYRRRLSLNIQSNFKYISMEKIS